MTHRKEAIEKLVSQVLDDTELRFAVDRYTLEEDLETGRAMLRCMVHDQRTGNRETITGEGVGIVDALFHGLVSQYSERFPSLTTIQFSDFALRANLDTGRQNAKSDSTGAVTLRIANSDGIEYGFTDASPSIARSAINVVLKAVAFFINSERAFIAVYRALQHARSTGRPDSVQLYTSQLATLVQATSYTEVIEQIRKSELASKAE